jgi:uncharacterized repeat protein (TIGR03803 family)
MTKNRISDLSAVALLPVSRRTKHVLQTTGQIHGSSELKKDLLMRSKRFSIGLRAALAIFTVTVFVTSTWAATQEKVLHNFAPTHCEKDGADPYASLIFDASGNLYGTTTTCGAHSAGRVFELMPKAGGGWTEKALHDFNGNTKDGAEPYAGLIFDKAGNLYGTTLGGGAHGDGTVFELMPKAGGGWTEKVLHNFNFNVDGYEPYAGLIIDASGKLYGTTSGGGAHGAGTVFELISKADGGWTEKVLHNFNSNAKDGREPYAGLIFDKAGNLYGTTFDGGAYGNGTVFELMPRAGGSWTEKVLHSFNSNGTDGTNSYASLIFDKAGNLYGTTLDGGAYGNGTVFELTPKAGGGWTEKVLYNFNGNTKDGTNPYAGLIFDASGNLYGTTVVAAQEYGTAFELIPKGGRWTEKVLHTFNQKDGAEPYAGLIFDASGNLYGTTYQGGVDGAGTVFELTPIAGGSWTETTH